MEVKKRRGRKALSTKDRLLKQSSTFAAFSRLFQTSAGKTLLQAERDEVLAKVCTGLSEVCKMLAGEVTVEVKRDEATKRVAELITEFSRCRQGRKVHDCEECGLLYHNFADCPLKPQHDEYEAFETSHLVDIKEAESLLPPDVAEELNHG